MLCQTDPSFGSYASAPAYVLLLCSCAYPYSRIAHSTINSDTPLSFLPETLRSLVGDGSIRPHPFYRPLIPIIGRTLSDSEAAAQEKPPKTAFTNPLRLFLSLVITLLLIFNAVLCAVFYGFTVSISTLFVEAYPSLTEIEIGLCFLAIGGGMLFGSCFTGRILDKEYRKAKENLEQKCRDDPESTMKPEDVTKDENFPIEYARLRTMPIYYVLFVVACIAYGWCLDRKVNIAGPLILQILSNSFEHIVFFDD